MPPKHQQRNQEQEESFTLSNSSALVLKSGLHQCAESHVFDATFCGAPAIVKIRVKKDYRHHVLDERIRFQRMQREARALARAAKNGVPVPTVYACDKRDCSIVMEKIMGCTVREVLETCCRIFSGKKTKENDSSASTNTAQQPLPPCSTSDELRATCSRVANILDVDTKNDADKQEIDESFFFSPPASSYNNSAAAAVCQIVCSRILFQMGRIIAKLHSVNAMHGDLTTSNFMVRGMEIPKLTEICRKLLQNSSNLTENLIGELEDLMSCCEVVIIDFGLVQESSNLEERAVDLYVLERAIVSTHPTLANAGQVVIDGYCAQMRHQEAAYDKEIARAKENNLGCGGRPNKQSANVHAIMERLEAVRASGRKRSMIG